jgi:predicted nucleic acid-binding protein
MNSMNAIDTNVLLYACDSRDAMKQQRALALIGSLRDTVLPWQAACEFVAASRKLGLYGFTVADAWARLGSLVKLFPLIVPTGAVLDRASVLHRDRGVAFWDAMLIAACLEGGVTRLYSEDVPGGRVPGIEIVNPFK